MSIRVNWTNPNTIFNEIRLYRTAVPVDYTNIPETPLVTLTTETTYLDTTAKQETYYYYTVAVIKDGEVVLAPSQLAYQLVDAGPGPTELVCGDMKRGYFGIVAAALLFTTLEIATLLGLAAIGGAGGEGNWCKYILDGRIIYYPQADIRRTVSWNQIYSLGLVFGIDGTGPGDLGVPAVNQLRIVSKGNNDFIVRLPRSATYGSPYTIPANWVGGSEAQLVMSATYTGGSNPTGWLGPTLAALRPTTTLDCWCQEYTGPTAASPRGMISFNTGTRATHNTQYVFRPILELVK